MGDIQWIIVALIVVLALYGAGAVGWALGQRARRRGPRGIKPVLRTVPVRAIADQLVDLGDLSALLDRRNVLVISIVTTGVGLRAEVVNTAVLDTTGAVHLNCLSPPIGRVPPEATDMHAPPLPECPQEVGIQPWPAVYAELVDLLNTATLVVSYNAGLHRRMVVQSGERHGLKRIPAIDWGCLMRRYTESTLGPEAQWIELPDAVSREGIVTPEAPRAMDDARAALELMRILGRQQGGRKTP